eukprot:Nk52_evm36s2039 gene=Nk52_evmTU36s2039
MSAASKRKSMEVEDEGLDWYAINTIRVLSAEQVQAAKSGHPGAPMGCAPMAYVLYAKMMRYHAGNPKWINRDRFVLSNGHGCALQYSMLHLAGYKLSLNELKNFRQLDSLTPGHPEANHTPGIEVTTGPLGQGISNAVGLAMAEAHLGAVFNKPGFPVFDNYTYCICGDGCLQEGVASEAASLAGHLGLGKLIVLYDDNKIQIDGSTDLAFTEDVNKRFESYGWQTLVVENGDRDIHAIQKAIEEGKACTDKPTLIKVRTTIGYASAKEGTAGVHGAPLGDEDLASVKKKLAFDPEKKFFIPAEVKDHFANIKSKGAADEKAYDEMVKKYVAKYPELGKEYKRVVSGELPAGWKDKLPKYSVSDKAKATRATSGEVLKAISTCVPELVGGSADLTGSNVTQLKGDRTHSFQAGAYDGRYMHFGVREHGMAAICNGISAYGGLIPFGATFLNFLGYCQGAVRLSALSKFRALYIMTHDSIGLGEDGPTHQAVEIMTLCRATPNLIDLRPADGNEVAGSYIVAMEAKESPSVLALSRQNVPNLEGSSVEKVAKGAYVLQDCANPDIILVSSGTEVSLVVEAAESLKGKLKCRIVSMPSFRLFESQTKAYKLSVFPDGVPVMSVEPYSTVGWFKYAHEAMGLSGFGTSCPYKQAYEKFGMTKENIAANAQKVAKHYKAPASLVNRCL